MRSIFKHDSIPGRIEQYVRYGLDHYARKLIPLQCYTLHSAITDLVANQYEVFGYMLTLLPSYSEILREEANLWRKFYLPNIPTGKVILDVGAGCGETAAFYLSNGAEKVIAIESNPVACNVLRQNVNANRMNVEIIGDSFKLEHLSIPHDFMKMDIEGGEAGLLEFHGKLGPCVIEVHDFLSPDLSTKLIHQFDLQISFYSRLRKTHLLRSS